MVNFPIKPKYRVHSSAGLFISQLECWIRIELNLLPKCLSTRSQGSPIDPDIIFLPRQKFSRTLAQSRKPSQTQRGREKIADWNHDSSNQVAGLADSRPTHE